MGLIQERSKIGELAAVEFNSSETSDQNIFPRIETSEIQRKFMAMFDDVETLQPRYMEAKASVSELFDPAKLRGTLASFFSRLVSALPSPSPSLRGSIL